MKKQKIEKIEPGCRARTNALYAKQISETPRQMEVLRPSRTIGGAWHCRWDGIEPEQVVHERFLEVIQ